MFLIFICYKNNFFIGINSLFLKQLVLNIMNFTAVLVAALIPLVIGFIWYNPAVFGKVWMRAIGVDPESIRDEKPNMIAIFGLSLLFALMLALSLNPMVIHQMGIGSLLQGMKEAEGEGAKIELLVNGVSIDYENRFRTFGHGALHGFICGLFFAVPIIGTMALYEKRGFNYIAVSGGYWIVCFMLMGGVICGWK
jgi:hypothetical protein